MKNRNNLIALGIVALATFGGWVAVNPKIESNIGGRLTDYDVRYLGNITINVPEGRRSLNLWSGCDKFGIRREVKLFSQPESPGIGIPFTGDDWEISFSSSRFLCGSGPEGKR